MTARLAALACLLPLAAAAREPDWQNQLAAEDRPVWHIVSRNAGQEQCEPLQAYWQRATRTTANTPDEMVTLAAGRGLTLHLRWVVLDPTQIGWPAGVTARYAVLQPDGGAAFRVWPTRAVCEDFRSVMAAEPSQRR